MLPSPCAPCQSRAALNPKIHMAIRLFHNPSRGYSAWSTIASKIAAKGFNRVSNREMLIDPLRPVAKEMKLLIGSMTKLLDSGHPSLGRVAKYYTGDESKHIRPLIVLLITRAASLCPKEPRPPPTQTSQGVNSDSSSFGILENVNSDCPLAGTHTTDPPKADDEILPSHRRLAEITELIHAAFLLHNDVIDYSSTNTMSVLAGNLLLGRASVALASLGNAEAVELLATVIANIVEGEFMHLEDRALAERSPKWSEALLSYYLQEAYLRTASLISKSCRASALLSGVGGASVDASYYYGKNIGLAVQLMDDVLAYKSADTKLVKLTGAGLKLRLPTAPFLLAWKTTPELGAFVERNFEEDGDVPRAWELILKSDGIEKTYVLAQGYIEKAISAIDGFPSSIAKDGLINIAVKVINKQK
ncbi:polyprenyl synthetase [Ilyonectria robusta]|uniref:polyprenyl synthetase n=1 Tax=Ilyonectria robusta TaxID=1079257 RepID=UPI001E8E28D8|nr:polyprenyl synthetase [Ilyonectria robusta]KAH8665461.1 polyprenyl synthetase [Ilyonectria robusta]